MRFEHCRCLIAISSSHAAYLPGQRDNDKEFLFINAKRAGLLGQDDRYSYAPAESEYSRRCVSCAL